MRVDAHVHVWQLARGDYAWLTPDLPIHRDYTLADYASTPGAHDVDRVVLVQAAPTAAETQYLLGLAASHPIVGAVTGWADLAAPGAVDQLVRLAGDPHLRAVRPMIQDIADPDWMLRPALAPALGAMVELDLALELLVRPVHLPRARTLLDQHPALRAIVNHAAKPAIAGAEFDAWARDLAALARDTSADCKLSGLLTEAAPSAGADALRPYTDHLLACFGPERLLWGSDWPVLTLAAPYDRWCAITAELLADLDPAARALIEGDNARRAYRLAGPEVRR